MNWARGFYLPLVMLLVLILLLALCAQSGYSCTTDYEGSDVTTTCSREVLDAIPDTVPDLTTHLIFAGNTLTNITYIGMLSRFFNLKVLNMSYNYLSERSFRPDVFSNIKTLTKLDLQKNRIKVLTSPFIRNAQIRVLKLDGNHLSHIPDDFLVNLPRLEELTLSRCKIETVSAQAFRSIGAHLQKLDLSENRLETLSVDLQYDIFTQYLLAIRLHDNLWNCDCRLKWLREEIDGTGAHWYFKGYGLVPECEEPKFLKHTSWFIANFEDFGCPPQLLDPQPHMVAAIGEDVTLSCTVLTYTIPHVVQWLQDDVTTDYKPRLKSVERYDGIGKILNNTLTINDFSSEDYGLYKCNVNTSFGWLTQTINVSAPDMDPRDAQSRMNVQNPGVIAAIIIVCIIVVVAVALVITFYLKKHLVHSGKLYMDGAVSSEMSQKSETDLSLSTVRDVEDREVTATTPLTMVDEPTDQPDLIKSYAEDELDSIPADMEYPIDDAGCAEYNEYLEAVSSTNHSPAFMESANSGPSTYIQTTATSQHVPVYMNPTIHNAPYVIDTNLMRTASPSLSNQEYQLANHNGSVASQANHMAPYTDTHTSSSDSGDSLSDPIVLSRMNTTPSGSPLTFIKEEPDEEEITTDLL